MKPARLAIDRLGVGHERRRALGEQLVRDRLTEPVLLLGVDDVPGPTDGEVGVADALGLGAQSRDAAS